MQRKINGERKRKTNAERGKEEAIEWGVGVTYKTLPKKQLITGKLLQGVEGPL